MRQLHHFAERDLRATGGINFNDPSGNGDQISLLASSTGSDFKYARAGYVIPVGSSGTRLGVSYAGLRYHLGEEFEALDAHGTAKVGEVVLTHPLLRTRRTSLQLRLSYEDKRYINSANGVDISDKVVRTLPLGLVFSAQDNWLGGGYSSASFDVTPGHLDLSGNAAFEAADALAERSAGRFLRTNYQLSRQQRLAGPFSLLASVSGQFSSANLESGEKISLGGPGRVRAYAARRSQRRRGPRRHPGSAMGPACGKCWTERLLRLWAHHPEPRPVSGRARGRQCGQQLRAQGRGPVAELASAGRHRGPGHGGAQGRQQSGPGRERPRRRWQQFAHARVVPGDDVFLMHAGRTFPSA